MSDNERNKIIHKKYREGLVREIGHPESVWLAKDNIRKFQEGEDSVSNATNS